MSVKQSMMVLPCGCVVPHKLGYVLDWLRRHNLQGLFDLLHSEDFVRKHRPSPLRG